MSTQPQPSISNIFCGEDLSKATGKRTGVAGAQRQSDVLNQTCQTVIDTPSKRGGKKLFNNRDNDILGVRERRTGEKQEVNETQLQVSGRTVQ